MSPASIATLLCQLPHFAFVADADLTVLVQQAVQRTFDAWRVHISRN
jgi:hypothetical protein